MKKTSLLTEEKVRELFREEFNYIKDDLIDKDTFKQKVTKYKDEVITGLDKVMDELKAIREEQTVISGYKDQIEDHETRITKVEEILQPGN